MSNLSHPGIVIEGFIDGFVKVSDPLKVNPLVHSPTSVREALSGEWANGYCAAGFHSG